MPIPLDRYKPWLTGTFIIAPGIGEKSEQQLWDDGFRHWDAVIDAKLPVSATKADAIKRAADQALEAYQIEDWAWFAARLGSKEMVRLLPWLWDKAMCIDIETNGGYDANDITIIGMHGAYDTHILVKGRDIERFPELFADVRLMVSFFGTGFDVPFLKRRFPSVDFDIPHVDVCNVMRRIGIKGGLKAIEHRFGIERSDEAAGLSGWDAVELWRLWVSRRDESALNRLIRYNREDIENLPALLQIAYPKLVAQTGAGWLHQIE